MFSNQKLNDQPLRQMILLDLDENLISVNLDSESVSTLSKSAEGFLDDSDLKDVKVMGANNFYFHGADDDGDLFASRVRVICKRNSSDFFRKLTR